MTSPVDIRPDHLGIVQDILRELLPVGTKVWVFGSRVNWTTKDSSDLDLALEGESQLSHKVLGTLKDAFEDSSLPYTVDVVDFDRIGDSFKQIVESQRTPLPLDEVVTHGAPLTAASGGWSKATLGDVCTKIGSGATPRGGKDVYLESGPYSLIRSQNVYNDGFRRDGLAFIGEHHAGALESVEVFEGDILLNITGDSVARACQVPADALPARVNQHVAIVRPDSAILDPQYLRYYLVSAEMQTLLSSWAGSGGTRNALTKGMLESLEIPLPPLPEQRAIGHILGALDDKIELNRRMNETLEAMARALFKSWFVDFEPVRAKMTGRWRQGESIPGLPAEHYDLFPDRLVESELGEVPEGWEVKALGELAKIIYGAAFASKHFNDSGKGLPLIRIRDLATHDPHVFTDEQHPKGQLIRPGDIVVGMDGEFRAHIWKGPVSWLNQRVCLFQPRQGVPSQFLMESLTGPLANFEHSKVGTTVIHLSKTDIDSINLACPPAEVFNTFASWTDPIVQQIVKCAVESRSLAAQRDTLLPRLVSGKVEVKAPGDVL